MSAHVMKTEIKKIDSCKRELFIELESEAVQKRYDSLLEHLTKEANIPGFRPGKATKDAVKRFLGKQKLDEEFIKETIPQVYREAVAAEKLDVIGLPQITEVNSTDTKFSFKATLEIRPDIGLKNYKGLKVKKNKVEIKEEDLKKVYDSLKQHYKVDKIDDNFMKGLGFPSVSEFEDSMKRQLLLSKEREAHQDIETQITQQLLDAHDFHLPSLLLQQEENGLKEAAKKQLKSDNLKDEDIEKKIKEAEKEFSIEAKKRIKLFLVFDEIAKKESIPRNKEYSFRKVMEFLLREADWGNKKK